MSRLFARNIDPRGRLVRAALAAALLISGVVLLIQEFALLGGLLLLAGAFVLFEAARGWCAFRACGIKTRL